MGMCASHTLRLKFKSEADKEQAVKAAADYIHRMEKSGNADFRIAERAKDGVKPDTLDGVAKMLLAYEQSDITEYKWRGFDCYANAFDSTYGWEMVLQDALEAMAPYLADASTYICNMDEGTDRAVVIGGKVSYY